MAHEYENNYQPKYWTDVIYSLLFNPAEIVGTKLLEKVDKALRRLNEAANSSQFKKTVWIQAEYIIRYYRNDVKEELSPIFNKNQ